MTAAGAPVSLLRADAVALPLADESVDLIVTSPPYFGLRSYTDGGEHYDGQIGSEATPLEFLEALWAVTAECKRVLKPTGSIFVNLGDKYAGSGGHNNAGLSGRNVPPPAGKTLGTGGHGATRRQAPDRYNQTADVRPKSLMGLPWLYVLGCTGALAALGGPDPGLDLILRAELVWHKRNGMPESVKDRVRRSHEQWFHLTKNESYYTAVDELREPHADATLQRAQPHRSPAGKAARAGGYGQPTHTLDVDAMAFPLGKLPGSVWTIPSEPLKVPDWLGVDHFAAFPTEWPRRLILGWSPPGICIACGAGRRPVVDIEHERYRTNGTSGRPKQQDITGSKNNGHNREGYPLTRTSATITGYSCTCWKPGDLCDPPPTRPAVVLDPFGGTGTTAMVARALGRYPVHVDLSSDYLRLARWRVYESAGARKTQARTMAERQGVLL